MVGPWKKSHVGSHARRGAVKQSRPRTPVLPGRSEQSHVQARSGTKVERKSVKTVSKECKKSHVRVMSVPGLTHHGHERVSRESKSNPGWKKIHQKSFLWEFPQEAFLMYFFPPGVALRLSRDSLMTVVGEPWHRHDSDMTLFTLF